MESSRKEDKRNQLLVINLDYTYRNVYMRIHVYIYTHKYTCIHMCVQ